MNDSKKEKENLARIKELLPHLTKEELEIVLLRLEDLQRTPLTNEEIIDQAKLFLEGKSPSKEMSSEDFMLVNFASKLLEGKSFTINTDDPAHMERYRALAWHLGASERKPTGMAAPLTMRSPVAPATNNRP